MRAYINEILRRYKVLKIFKRITIEDMVSLDYIEVKTYNGEYYKLYLYYTKAGLLNPSIFSYDIDTIGFNVDSYEELVKTTDSRSSLEKKCRIINKGLMLNLNKIKDKIQNIKGTIDVTVYTEPIPMIIATYKYEDKLMKPINYIFGARLPDETDSYIEKFNTVIGGSIDG